MSPTSGPSERCERDACVREALDSHPGIAEARAQVEKAALVVRFAKYDFIPDVEAFARYTFHNHSAFFADRFGTIGIRASVDLFEGGRKRAVLRERETQLAQAKENLARVSDEVELCVQTAYNKLERPPRWSSRPRAALLQSQLHYAQAADEMDAAVGRRPQ